MHRSCATDQLIRSRDQLITNVALKLLLNGRTAQLHEKVTKPSLLCVRANCPATINSLAYFLISEMLANLLAWQERTSPNLRIIEEGESIFNLSKL